MTSTETRAPDGGMVPRHGELPPLGNSIEAAARRRATQRRRALPKMRLTQKVHDDLVRATQTGLHPALAYRYAGVDSSIFARWMRAATDGEGKPYGQTTQLERRAMMLKQALREAEGQAALRTHGAIAQAGGLTAERPRSTVTRQIIKGATFDPATGKVEGGQPGDVTIEVKEHAPDWRAAAHIGKYRWPDEMGDGRPEPEEDAGPPVVSARAAYELLQQVRRQREKAGVDDSDVGDVVDAELVENSVSVSDPPKGVSVSAEPDPTD